MAELIVVGFKKDMYRASVVPFHFALDTFGGGSQRPLNALLTSRPRAGAFWRRGVKTRRCGFSPPKEKATHTWCV